MWLKNWASHGHFNICEYTVGNSDTPFYFNEIQATTNFIQDGTDQVLYGVFNTPDNSIAGSAICAFRLSDITETFEIGPFK